MLLFPESAGCNISQAFRSKVQPVGHAAGRCWQEPGIINKVRPVRHAAGLVVDETLGGDEPQLDHRPEAAVSNIHCCSASIIVLNLHGRSVN